MSDELNLPALNRQITELVLTGSTEHAEAALDEVADQRGDLAIVEILETLSPEVACMHLSAFDGGKLSLATLLISPASWAQSLAYFAAIWRREDIEDEPEILSESLYAHIHGVLFASDDQDRRAALIHEALLTDWGTTAFATLFSTAIGEIVELANEIHARGAQNSGTTSSDHDIIPLALAVARTDVDAWDRVLLELFPDWQPGDNELHARPEEEDEQYGYEYASPRNTQELLTRLRSQVPSKATSNLRATLGEDIFS